VAKRSVPGPREQSSGGRRLGLAGVGIAAAAVICCATLPLLAGVVSGAAVGAVLGVGAGALVTILLVAAILAWARHRQRGPRAGLRETAAVRAGKTKMPRSDPWSRRARAYDMQLALELRPIRAMLEMLEVTGPDQLLDLGTGTGAVLRELQRHSVRPSRLVGVDASAAMLDRARAALPPSTELVTADAASLPFAESSFEVVSCAYLLHLLDPDERGAILGEAGRVLSPGGRIGVVSIAPPSGWLSRALSWPVRAIARHSSGVLAGLRPLDPAAELRAAGFEVRAQRRVRVGYPSLCVVAIKPS